MKHSSVISAFILIIAILVMLIQLWFSVWSHEIFTKIIITIGALLVISLVISFVYKEINDTKRFKNGGNLDQ
jgi:Na+-translocating ferredoxin:NAD+ oxidoreductase RnfE subunit